MTPKLTADPDGLVEVARSLERIAGRLDRMIAEQSGRLVPLPVGFDEVSRGVADSLGRAAQALQLDAADGARAAREFASVLRSQAREIAAADSAALSKTD